MSERCRRFKSSIFTGEPTKNVQEASFLAMALQVAAAAIVGDDFADVAETSVQPEWGSSSGMAALGKWTSDIGASVQCINSPYPKITRETKLGHTIRIILKKDNRNA